MKKFKLFTAILLLQMSVAVEAALVELTNKQTQTEAGQVFIFDFDNVPLSDGVDGKFILHVRGDYSLLPPNTSDETITVEIMGATEGPKIEIRGFSIESASSVTQITSDDNEWSSEKEISGLFLGMFGLLTPGENRSINMTITLGDDVFADLNTENFFVEATLLYTTSAVPVPAAVLLFGTGFLSLLGMRRVTKLKG